MKSLVRLALWLLVVALKGGGEAFLPPPLAPHTNLALQSADSSSVDQVRTKEPSSTPPPAANASSSSHNAAPTVDEHKPPNRRPWWRRARRSTGLVETSSGLVGEKGIGARSAAPPAARAGDGFRR